MTKTLSFAVVHFTVAFGVGYLLTDSILVGSVLALVEPAVNTAALPGRSGPSGTPRAAAAPRYDARASASAA
jgi:hypothetical protein